MTAAETPIPDATQALSGDVGRLGYFAEKVRDRKSVTIGFLGGSITQGVGAETPRKAYWWLTRQALTKAIDERHAESNYILAAVGGTNSVYGSYRVGVQLLDKDIDLLVVEFAVNDRAAPSATEGMEGIVRQAWKRNPRMGIVFLYTVTAGLLRDYYSHSKIPPSVEAHHAVAQRYGIAEVHCGPLVQAGIAAGNFNEKQFFKDGVHPTDVGHEFYADLLSRAIISALDWKAVAQVAPLPEPLGTGQLEFARMVSLDNATRSGSWEQIRPSYYTYLGLWRSSSADAKIQIPITGSNVGLLVAGSCRLRYSGAGFPVTEANVNVRKDGVPTMFMLPVRETSDPGLLTIEPVARGESPPQLELAAVLLNNPVPTTRPAEPRAFGEPSPLMPASH